MVPTESLPRILDRYELLAELGSGAFATVYRARHVHTEQAVAVKVLQRGEGTTQGIERWLSEARAMAAVTHPNVVRVLDCGRAASGEAFLVMELAEGTTLDAMLGGRTLPVAHAVRLATQMLEGLSAAHAKGIVHRDVKPPNVLVTHDDRGNPQAKLLDFGVSKVVSPGITSGTLPGTVMGTPGYMAPELFGDAANADPRVDVYAVAATLFEMLSGRLPFLATSYEDLLVQVRTARPPPLKAIAPHVPAALAEVIDRGLARDRDARWPSAAAFVDALRGSVSQSMVPSPPELAGTMDARNFQAPEYGAPTTGRIPPPPLLPRDPDPAIARTDPPGHGTLKSNPPPVAQSTLRSSESKSRAGMILVVVGGLLVVATGAAVGVLLFAKKSETLIITPVHGMKEPAMETRSAERVTAVGALPFDPADDPKPLASGVASVASAAGSASAREARAGRGMTFVPVRSVTNHVTDASLAAFGRAVATRGQLCRPSGAPATVEVELLVGADGEIGIAHVPPGNKGDKLVAECVASAFKEVSDKGGRLSGDGIVQVLVTLEPR